MALYFWLVFDFSGKGRLSDETEGSDNWPRCRHARGLLVTRYIFSPLATINVIQCRVSSSHLCKRTAKTCDSADPYASSDDEIIRCQYRLNAAFGHDNPTIWRRPLTR